MLSKLNSFEFKIKLPEKNPNLKSENRDNQILYQDL